MSSPLSRTQAGRPGPAAHFCRGWLARAGLAGQPSNFEIGLAPGAFGAMRTQRSLGNLTAQISLHGV
eukprot:4741417-Pyramimonas_sp.AAC.2